MLAIYATQFGSPAVLSLAEGPDIAPGPGQISIDVTHAAVGLIDGLLRQGQFKDMPGMPQPPFIPGLEVAGTVRALGEGVVGFTIGEKVVSMATGNGTGGYASIYVASVHGVVSIDRTEIDPALAVSVIPNAAMAHVALTRVAHLAPGESVLVHGALGGLAAAFPGMAKQLGASRVVGTVRTSKLPAAAKSRLPYDRIVDSADFAEALGGERFDVVIDAVGGAVRSSSFALMKSGSRLIVAGNASGDWTHQLGSNDLWLGSVAVMGFNAGAYLPSHPETVRPALDAAVRAVAAGLANTEVQTLPFSQAALAHQRLESRALDGRMVLVPGE